MEQKVNGELTRHGAARMQQRSVPPLIVEWLLAFGACVRRDGVDVFFFDKKARRDLERKVGRIVIRRLGDKLNTYLVMSDSGIVVTIGYRTGRLNNVH